MDGGTGDERRNEVRRQWGEKPQTHTAALLMTTPSANAGQNSTELRLIIYRCSRDMNYRGSSGTPMPFSVMQ